MPGHHHILLDGWSVQLIAKELISLYHDEPISSSKQYEEYVNWLAELKTERSEDYWNSLLNKHDYATTPGRVTDSALTDESNEKLIRLKWELNKYKTDKLRSIAKEKRVTLNHLLKTIWALLLSKWNQSESICYGVTVSGRPYQIEGADQMAGLFINTVPEALRIEPNTSIISVAQKIRDLEFEREAHEYHTAGLIHQWSGFPGAKPMFESLLVFDDYNHQEPQHNSSLQISFEDQWYRGGTTTEPVTILINAGDIVHFEFTGLTRNLNQEALRSIVDHYMQMINGFFDSGPDQTVDVLIHTLSGANPLFQLKPKRRETSEFASNPSSADPKMTEIWKEVLGTVEIQPDDNFFELGGHSLLAIKIANRIRDRFSVEIPLKNLFQNPTLNGMSEQVRIIRNSMDQIQMQAEAIDGESEEGEL